MLTDLIATALAFIVVVLLLSLVVTGLTQFIAASLRLRVQNLRRALTVLINDLGGGGGMKADVRPHVDATITAANFGTTQAPKDMIAGLGLIRLSWIRNEDLVPALTAAGLKLSAEQATKAKHSFKLLESYMEKRFALFARFITVGTAIVIAVIFQVSSPHLLRQLWTDAELRARYVAVADRLKGEEGEKLMKEVAPYTVDMQTLSLEALDEVAKAHPDEAAAFEEFSGKDVNAVDAREELSVVLEGSPKRDEIVAEFEKALDRRLTDAQHRGTVLSDKATGELAALDITPWKGGWDYYSGNGCLGLDWGRVFGVLITALLLTFGAPFWYDRLKDVARLRDVVGGGKKNEPAQPTTAG